MTTPAVVARVHEGWISLSAHGLHLIVAAGEERREELTRAAAAGLVPLLEALGPLSALPDFGIADTSAQPVRVLLRGRARAAVGESEGESAGREPWREFEVAGEIALLGPEPPARGWRRPTRFASAATAATQGTQAPPYAVSPDPEPASPPAVAEPDADESAAEPEPSHDPDPEPSADLTLPPPPDGDSAPPVDRVRPVPPPPTSLIDHVPWRRDSAPEEAAPPPPVYSTPPPGRPSAPVATAYEAAPPPPPVSSGPPPAPVSAPPPPPPPPTAVPVVSAPPPPPVAPTSPAAELTTDRGSLLPTNADPAGAEGPIVLAVLCPAGHASSPHAGSCRVCGRDIPPQQPFQTPRPRLGVLRISTGGVVPLDRGVLLGRSPRVNADLPPNARPHLVRLASADNDISRNHAEVVLEGWHVLVRDLGSTNGTTVALPGQAPVRLRPTEDQGIEPGTVISLADEVTLVYEVDA